MKKFAALYRALDASTSSLAKQAALQDYFRNAAASDAAWAVYFLAGGKPRQIVPNKLLKALAQTASGLPQWLFDESYDAVGDLAETISLLLPAAGPSQDICLSDWLEQHLLPLRGTAPEHMTASLLAQWQMLPMDNRLVYFKLITGSFRVGVSKLQVTQALAAVSDLDSKRIAQRLMGYTQPNARPSAAQYLTLLAPVQANELDQRTSGQPYPFFLAHPLPGELADFETSLGPPTQWLAEWKWDGIRAQLVKRGGQVWLWSRGEELLTERFPELAALGHALPDGTVLDGEILIWRNGLVQSFAELQKRIGRKTVSEKLLKDLPVVLLAYDLLEHAGHDIRTQSQSLRRSMLVELETQNRHPCLVLSEAVTASSWQGLALLRETARKRGVEGLMLKSVQSQYGVGRTKDVGVWWKWKLDPLNVDAVLIYAQRGHGRRASLYSDYTFAVWDGPQDAPARKLVPFAKAYSGLTDQEMQQVDAIVRKTTRESFGPVRSVEPTLVFELGFEGIARSPRHKSGIAVRFPRMLRWRHDKTIAQADTLQSLEAMLAT
jgi:DNA ligase 1